ncbi:hypothetical protein [Leifsonia aquatica]|uniref:hypothetical protein n=1 Tax=Leifsonia aquatica TaxID=144185 RepID=UPI0038118941
MGRVLLCTNHLQNLAGSEVVTIELVEHFLERGWHVDVYTNLLGEPVTSELLALPSWGRLRVVEASPEEAFDDEYDLIWVQHSLFPPSFVDRLVSGVHAPVVWHHLSSFMNIEMPILADIERSIASVSSSMSTEGLDALARFGLDAERFVLFDNPAPDRFADHPMPGEATGLARLLIVSNHPPAEMVDAASALRSRGVLADVLGDVVGSTPRRISPEILAGYDAVVTIGKTVPAALSMGLPVYAYDHFGGCGWLGADNLDREAAGTFAGRLTESRRTAEAIADEIVSGYPAAAAWARDARASNAERWRLSARISAILADPRLHRDQPARIDPAALERYRAFIALHGDLFRLAKNLETTLRTTRAELEHERVRAADLERDAAVARAVAAEADRRAEQARRVLDARAARSQETEASRRRLLAVLGSRTWQIRGALGIGRGGSEVTPARVLDMSGGELHAAASDLDRSRWLRMARRLRRRRTHRPQSP